MPTVPDILNAGPVRLNSTVLPVFSWSLPQQLQEEIQNLSGFTFPAAVTHLIAGEPIIIRVPLWNALALVGLSGLALTTLDIYAGLFGDLVRETAATTTHSKWSLSGGATTVAKAFIRPFSATQDQVALAEIVIVPLAKLALTRNNALPAPATPVWHTLGNSVYAGAVWPGTTALQADLGAEPSIRRSDGHQYPVDCKLLARAPRMVGSTTDPDHVQSIIDGISSEEVATLGGTFTQHFREHDAATGQHKSTGFTLSCASGEGILRGPGFDAPGQDAVTGDWNLIGLQGAGAHPFTLSANTVASPE